MRPRQPLALVIDQYKTYGIRTALVNHEIAVMCSAHIANDADARRYRPALKLLSCRIESQQHIGALLRLVEPDNVVDDFDGVGV